jgi:hypothetical protein
MKKITHARLLELFTYNKRTGLFKRRVTIAGQFNRGDIAGTKTKLGYVQLTIDGQRYYAHRLAWFYVHRRWPTGQIDHRAGIRSDNRFKNLRDVSLTTNRQNQRQAHSDSQTGFIGVTFNKHRGKFQAQLCANGVRPSLGYFVTAPAAHRAYVRAKRKLHAGCTL